MAADIDHPTTLLLDDFLEGYHTWSVEGKGLAHASRELRYCLNRQRKRLAVKHVEIEDSYEHVKEEIRGSQSHGGFPYSSKVLYRESMRNLTIRRDGKTVKHAKRPVTFYGTLLEKRGYEDEPCTCPNCGHRSMVSEVQEGCPYCGTRFETEDVYPCFTSFYTVNGITERAGLMDRLKKRMLIGGLAVGIIMFLVYFFFVEQDYNLLGRTLISLFSGAMMGAMAALIVYLVCGIVLLGKVFGEAGKALPLLSGLGTRRKLEAQMKLLDPGFSFEYFEGRIISLFRTLAFSDDRQALSIYAGNGDLSFLDDLVDIQYRGALQLLDVREAGGMTEVTVKAFMTNIHAGEHVRERNENYILRVVRETGAQTDFGFSWMAIECPGCGGSFDALHLKACPYCNRPYNPAHNDWVITEVRKA